MHTLDIDMKNITKIEGHANLSLKVRNGAVEAVRFSPYENNRFFEKIIVGRHYSEAPGMVARICGFCSAAHLLTAIEACENALGIEVSDQTAKLRELLAIGGAIVSHSLHLYFLALPDYLKVSSALELSESKHGLLHQALRIKKAGTTLQERIGGRALHMLSPCIGGFAKLPSKEDLLAAEKALEAARKDVLEAIGLFASLKPQLNYGRSCDYLAVAGKKYSLLYGNVFESSGVTIPAERYKRYLHEISVPYSTSKQVEFQGRSFMVGALARMNLNSSEMQRSVKKQVKKHGLEFPSQSPYDNNLAQAIELLQFVDSSLEIINGIKIRSEKPRQPAKHTTGMRTGVAISEAPRGTLFHEYALNSSGRIANAHIIVPTSQNSRRIEDDLRGFVPKILHKPKREIVLDIEKLIRAYDPCISCATHFLRVKWL